MHTVNRHQGVPSVMPAQRVGQTTHFFYEYDDALGVKAQTLALALMATCEGDLFQSTYAQELSRNGPPE
jgi:hypothetical protein